jgi:hypothetical protein
LAGDQHLLLFFLLLCAYIFILTKYIKCKIKLLYFYQDADKYNTHDINLVNIFFMIKSCLPFQKQNKHKYLILFINQKNNAWIILSYSNICWLFSRSNFFVINTWDRNYVLSNNILLYSSAKYTKFSVHMNQSYCCFIHRNFVLLT